MTKSRAHKPSSYRPDPSEFKAGNMPVFDFNMNGKSIHQTVLTKQGEKKWGRILSNANYVASSAILPTVWPTPQISTAYSCGLYAISTALACNGLHIPVRKKDDRAYFEATKNHQSLRSIAKAAKLTQFGEIFNRDSLTAITDTVAFNKIDDAQISNHTEREYIDGICKKLKNGFNVIVSADVDQNTRMPSSHNGFGAHWALIFGYYQIKQHGALKEYFLVADNGGYYVWDARELYLSNKSLPVNNPYYGYIYQKSKIFSGDGELMAPEKMGYGLFNKQRIIDVESLEKFKFTAFGIYNPHLLNAIPLHALTVQGYIDLMPKLFFKNEIEQEANLKNTPQKSIKSI